MPLRVVSSTGSAVSAGAVQVVVPDVTGATEAEAKAALDDFTVRVRKVEALGTAGTVLAQDPEADEIRPKRSTVTIFVIVTLAPDSADVATALAELKQSVDNLGTTLETEQAAKDRHDVVLQRLQEIKDGLLSSGVAVRKSPSASLRRPSRPSLKPTRPIRWTRPCAS